jgi:fimbrial chaperone protein
MKRHKIGQALRGLALTLVCVSTAHAGSFAVNPVRVTLSATQMVAAVTVRNVGTEPTVVQLETSSWAQHDGKDELPATTDILATPPILTIPPGGARIVRVGLRRPPDARNELAYRLFLREVPPPEPVAQGLRVALLVSMPVFVVPPHIPGPQLEWHLKRTRDNQIRVEARNSGKSHVQLGRLDITLAAAGQTVATRNMSEYVMPDNVRAWVVDATTVPPVGTLLRISSQTDSGPMGSDIRLEEDVVELNPTLPAAASR